MLFIGKNIIRLISVDSTNNYAAQLLRQSVIYEGTVIVAEFQEKGKGQRGNEWESEPGKNLTFSIVLKPSFIKPGRQFLLHKIISLGIYDFLTSPFGPLSKWREEVKIKWPNDVLVKEKKIAGILIENTIRSDEIVHCVAGIGFNVNQTKFHSAENATSLKMITGKNFVADECLENICSCIEAWYLRLKSDLNAADEDYLKKFFQFNEWKIYSIKGMQCNAKITGVSAQGLLIVERENGEFVNCDFKEIKFL